MYYRFGEYVSVEQKRKKAEKLVEKLREQGQQPKPVAAFKGKMAGTFWGKSWCENLEAYADFENRLGRGRSYARSGCVCHLDIEHGAVKALVSGSDLYTLTVRVMSFAYKKGIPADPSGNGGGYVFDCRAINNPGKYERYNNVTGLDEPVIHYLEEDGEIITYLDSIYKLVDSHVKRYMERNFSHLMVAFGCTGGQHRSVYAAQHVAEHISKKFGVKVNLVHREQNIEQEFKGRG